MFDVSQYLPFASKLGTVSIALIFIGYLVRHNERLQKQVENNNKRQEVWAGKTVTAIEKMTEAMYALKMDQTKK